MLKIKILGSGCSSCDRLEKETKKAVHNLAVEAEIVKITDYKEITKFDILSTPGLVINDKVVSSGRIPAQAEIITLLADALEAI